MQRSHQRVPKKFACKIKQPNIQISGQASLLNKQKGAAPMQNEQGKISWEIQGGNQVMIHKNINNDNSS